MQYIKPRLPSFFFRTTIAGLRDPATPCHCMPSDRPTTRCSCLSSFRRCFSSAAIPRGAALPPRTGRAPDGSAAGAAWVCGSVQNRQRTVRACLRRRRLPVFSASASSAASRRRRRVVDVTASSRALMSAGVERTEGGGVAADSDVLHHRAHRQGRQAAHRRHAVHGPEQVAPALGHAGHRTAHGARLLSAKGRVDEHRRGRRERSAARPCRGKSPLPQKQRCSMVPVTCRRGRRR